MGIVWHSRYSKNMALLLLEQMFDLYTNEQMFVWENKKNICLGIDKLYILWYNVFGGKRPFCGFAPLIIVK